MCGIVIMFLGWVWASDLLRSVVVVFLDKVECNVDMELEWEESPYLWIVQGGEKGKGVLNGEKQGGQEVL